MEGEGGETKLVCAAAGMIAQPVGTGSHHDERLGAHREALGKPDSQWKKDGWKQAQAMGKGLVAAWQQQPGAESA